LIADKTPYGGFTIGNPWTFSPPPARTGGGAPGGGGSFSGRWVLPASAAQQSPGPRTTEKAWPPIPSTYRLSENFGGGAVNDLAPGVFPAWAKIVCVSGSYAEPGQFVAVPGPITAIGPLTLPRIGGVKTDVPTLYRSST